MVGACDSSSGSFCFLDKMGSRIINRECGRGDRVGDSKKEKGSQIILHEDGR